MAGKKIVLSSIPKTWIIDLDGVTFFHNRYKEDKEKDEIIPEFKALFKVISDKDLVIIITSRKNRFRKYTVRKLRQNHVRFNYLIMNAPNGERIVIDDVKPSGLKTAYSISVKRDEPHVLKNIEIDKGL